MSKIDSSEFALNVLKIADELQDFLSKNDVPIIDSVLALSMLAARAIHATGNEAKVREIFIGGMEAALKDMHLIDKMKAGATVQ